MRDYIAGLRASASGRTREVLARIQRTTPRERILLGALIVGAVVYTPIAVTDWRARQEDRYIDAIMDRSAARLAAESARRVAATAADESALRDMETWGLEATNVQVAQVRLEQRLIQTAQTAGLTGVRITTESEVETIGPTQWLGAEVQAELRWAPTFAFLDALSGWPEGFRVTSFRYEMTPVPTYPGQTMTAPQPLATGTVRIGLAVPVSLPEVAAGPGATS